MLCQALWTSVFSEPYVLALVSVPFATPAVYKQPRPAKLWWLVKSDFPTYSLVPPDTSEEADLSCSSSWPVALSQHSTLVQCVWPCAPRRVSLSDKYSQGHPLAPSLRPVGAWQTPHNNSVLMVLLSQEVGWGAAASKNLWLGVWA